MGGNLAYEVSIEEGKISLAGEQIQINHRVTNIFRRDGHEWKMVHYHYHADLSPAMLELLSRLQTPPQ